MKRAIAGTYSASGEGQKILADRTDRLARIVGDVPLIAETGLVKAVRLPPAVLARLQGAASTYVWHSLCQAFPGTEFALSTDCLSEYAGQILSLPNRTPNGLLLPRRETFLSFNLVQQAVVHALVELRLVQSFAAFQMPCNVRIVSGAADKVAESRPYASSKMHSDIWYGEPLSAILFNIPVLGDPSAVSISFFEASDFPAHLMCVLDDYSHGKDIVAKARRSAIGFELGTLYMSDSLSLHQTTKSGSGIRLSLDFRCLARELLPGETASGGTSRAVYVDPATWQRSGSTLVLSSGDPLDAFQRRARGEAIEPEPLDFTAISPA